MFGATWVSESTSSTANFTSNTDQVFSMKYCPNGWVISIKYTVGFKDIV